MKLLYINFDIVQIPNVSDAQSRTSARNYKFSDAQSRTSARNFHVASCQRQVCKIRNWDVLADISRLNTTTRDQVHWATAKVVDDGIFARVDNRNHLNSKQLGDQLY